MEQSSTPTSSSEAASVNQNDDVGESSASAVSVPVADVQAADPEEAARIRSLFPLPLPSEVMRRIEHLAYMNCIHEHKRALHREMMDTEIFLTIVDTRTWNGQDYLGAHRIPPLISGVASDSDEWDSDWNSDEEEEGMIGWGGVFAGAAGGGGGGGNGNGAPNHNNPNDHPVLQDLLRMMESRLGTVPHPNQQAAS